MIALWLWWACAPREVAPLTDPAGWSLSRDGDPFPSHAAPYAECPFDEAGAFYEEGGVLEVDTGACGYLILTQASLVDVRPGDMLSWSVGHSDLIAAGPAQAHVAITLGDDVLWDWTQVIPAPSGFQLLTAEAPSRAPAGTPLRIHMHNHGQNKWLFVDDQVEPR